MWLLVDNFRVMTLSHVPTYNLFPEYACINPLNNICKKLLDSDWLTKEQCSPRVTPVSPVQITTKISQDSPKTHGEPYRLPKVIRVIPKISEL